MRGAEVEAEILGLETALRGRQSRALEHVAQLPDVARPGVRLQAAQRPGRESRRRRAASSTRIRRRNSSARTGCPRGAPAEAAAERNRADPIVEVAAETLLLDQAREVLVRRRDQPDVDLAVPDVSQPAESLLLEDLQELRLDQRGPRRRSRPGRACRVSATSSSPALLATAPVNAPFSWPKSSVSRSSRDRPAQFRSRNTSSLAGPVARGARRPAPPCRCRSRRG